jgi:hypothetical protein
MTLEALKIAASNVRSASAAAESSGRLSLKVQAREEEPTERISATRVRHDAYRAARRKVPLKFYLRGGHMHPQDPTVVVTLTAVTLGLYGLLWLYRTSRSLRNTTGEPQIHPLIELVLTLGTGGLFGLWASFRNTRMVHATSLYFRRSHRDLSNEVLWMFFFAPFTLGVTLLVAMFKQQVQLNEYAKLSDERERARIAGSSSTPSLERVVPIVPVSTRVVRASDVGL